MLKIMSFTNISQLSFYCEQEERHKISLPFLSLPSSILLSFLPFSPLLTLPSFVH